MAMNGGKIEFGIGYKVDQSGLKSVESQLRNLSHMLPEDFLKIRPDLGSIDKAEAKLNEVSAAARELREAYSNAFDDNTGLYNIEKLKTSLKGMDIGTQYKKLSEYGEIGIKTFRQMTNQVNQVNLKFRETNGFLDKMGETLVNTVKWSIASSAVNKFSGAVQQAWGYVQHLDTSLNDIRIVTGKSADEMGKFAIKANDAAKALGSSTTEYTEAALIYYQQGLSDKESQARAETTLKAANVTGQTGQQVSEELTAVWNGYKVTAEETEMYVDKLAAVAASTASDLEELSTGMSKVASAANNMGVDVDQLNAQLATIVSVTRQAPETAGTALKTIFARIEDLKLGGTDEDGIKLGQVSSGLESMGIEIKNAQGDLRDLGEVIEEIGTKWDSWTESQQSAIAQLVAGKRQYNNLLALFDNWDMYNEALDTSRNSLGTLQNQQDIYMESTEAHLQTLNTQREDLYDSLFDTDSVNDLVDDLTDILGLITNIIDSIGGGKGLLLGMVAILTKIKPINAAITREITGIMNKSQAIKSDMKQWSEFAQTGKAHLSSEMPLYKERLNLLNQLEVNARSMTLEEKQQVVEELKKLDALSDQLAISQSLLNNQKTFIQNSAQALVNTGRVSDDNKDQVKNIGNSTEEKPLESLEGREAARKVIDEQKAALDDLEVEWQRYIEKVEDAIEIKKDWEESLENNDEGQSIFLHGSLDGEIEDVKVLRSNLQDLLDVVGPAAEKDVQDLINLIDELPDDLSDIQQSNEQNTESLEKIKQKAKEVIEAVKESEKQASDAIEQAGQDAQAAAAEAAAQEEQRIAARNQEIAQSITNITQGVTSILFAVNSISNIGDIITDSSLSGFEKFSQISTALVMTIPMVVSSVKSLTTGFVGLIGPVMENIAADAGLVTADGLVTAAGAAKIGVVEGETIAREKLVGVMIKQKAVQLLTNPIFWKAAAAIGAVTAAITLLTKAHKDKLEADKKYNESLIETNKKLIEQKEKNIEVVKSLKDLINQYKEGTIAEEDFNKKKVELLSSMDAESRVALNLASNWDAAQKALNEYNIRQEEAIKKAASEDEMAAAKNMLNAASDWEGSYDPDTQTFTNTWQNWGENGMSDEQIKLWKTISSRMSEAGANFQDLINDEGYFEVNLNDEKALDTLNAYIKVITQLHEEGVDLDLPGFTDNLYDDIKQMTKSKAYKEFTEAREKKGNSNEELAGLKSGFSVAKTIEEGNAAYKKFKDYLITNQNYTLQQVNDAWLKYLSSSSNEIASQMIQIQSDFETMTNDWSRGFQGNFETTDFYKKAKEIQNYLEENNLTEGISLFSPEEWTKLIKQGINGMSTEEIANAVQGKITDSLNKSFDTFKTESANTTNTLQQIISDAISGSVETGEDSNYAKIKEQIEALINYYPELSEQASIFYNENIIGTEKWMDATYQLQQAFNALELSGKVDDFSKKVDKLQKQNKFGNKDYSQGTGQYITIEPDIKKFSETMDDIMNADYSINVEIDADMQENFDNLIDSMENADNLASKIGEDFIVSAEDISEIAAAFPGILDGYQDLGNGTIQLNEEIAKSAIDAANQAEIASTEELINDIKNTNEKLEMKKEHYQKILDIASESYGSQEELAQKQKDIEKETLEIEKINQELVNQEEIDNAKKVADNNAENAQIVAQNWNDAYSIAETASINEAETAIENAKQKAQAEIDAANGTITSAQPSKKRLSQTNWTGKKGTSTTIDTDKTLKDTEETDEDYINRIKKDAQTNIDALTKQISANTGRAAEAAARLGKSVTSNNNIGKSSDSSSSSSSEEEAETVEYLEKETDLYREINEELDDIESTLSRIQKINDHSWGLSAKKSLEQENELLNEQNKLLEKKAETYKSDLATRRKALEDQGVTFSDDGSTMTNAEERLTTLYNEYNAMVDKYNAMSVAEQENYKSTLEAKKETIENIENAMDDYESAYNDYNSVLDEILDNHYELIENAVNQFNADIDIKLELDDAKEQWEDFWAEIMEDVEDTDFFAKFNQNIKKLDIYTGITSGVDTSEIAALTKHVMDTNSEVGKQIASADNGGADSIFKDDSALSKETLTKYRDNLIDAVKAANDAINEMSENYLNELEKAKDLIDDQIKGLNSVNDHIEHTINVIKMISGEKAYDQIQKQLQNQYDNNLKIIETNKKAVDFYANQMEQNKKAMESAQGTKDYETFKKAYETSVEEYRNAVKDLDASIEEGLEVAQKLAEVSIKETMDDLDKKMFGGVGYDRVKSQWDLIIQEQDYYLDNVERALEMESLQFDFSDVLKDMDLRGEKQQEFLKFMDEENAKLKEKNKLTQYDIDEVKARLEIKKAEMALEDAQRNKSNMRLRRDTQGNYTYQYTANEDAIEDAEKGLMSAKKEWWELVKQRNKETANEVLNIQKQLYDAIDDYQKAMYANDENAAAEAKERMERLQIMLDERYGESDKAKRDMYANAETFFEGVDATRLQMWDTHLSDMIKEWDNGGEDSFIGAVNTSITKIDDAIDDYKTRAEADFKAAGRSLEDYTGEIDKTKAALDKLVMSEEELDNELGKVNNNLKEMAPKLSEAVKGFDNLKAAAAKAIEEANKSLEELAKTAIETVKEIEAAVEAAQTAPSLTGTGGTSSGGSTDSGSMGNTGNTTPTTPTEPTKKSYPYEAVQDPYGAHETPPVYGIKLKGSSNYIVIDTKDKLKKMGYTGTNVKGVGFEYYRSGGYTGDWSNDNGRLAVLHQKELVLNEADTSNLLKAVSLIRTLVGVANSADFNRIANSVVGAGSTSAQLANSVSSGALQSIASNVTNNSNVSNTKDVTINADFSGVRSADAIYQALIELQNYGMQESYSTAPHANRSY